MIVQAAPSKDLRALKHAMLSQKALIAQFNEVSSTPLSEETRAMGLKAIMTPELRGEYLRQSSPPDGYSELYKYIQGYVGRLTYGGGDAGEHTGRKRKSIVRIKFASRADQISKWEKRR